MAAGIAARQAGASVTLIKRGTLGGTCVNVGCVPSKTLLAAAGIRHSAGHHPFAGIRTSADGVNLAALVAQKEELTSRLRQAKYAQVAQAYGFPLMTGEARFRDAHTLEVDGQVVPARSVVIATGSQPRIPDLPGLADADYLTSTTAMELEEVPSSLLVIGGGYVGMEQAQLFADLGAHVTVVGRLAPDAEPELATTLREVFTDDGITVVEEHAVGVEATSDEHVRVHTHSGERRSAARACRNRPRRGDRRVEPASGRCANRPAWLRGDRRAPSHHEPARVRGRGRGRHPAVRLRRRGLRPGRCHNALAAAAGDVGSARMDYTGLPAVVFKRPQLASSGLTEEQALAGGHAFRCRILDRVNVPRALVNRDTQGVVKLVADAGTGRVLGVHAVAEGAGEIMLAATYAMKAQLTVDDVADTWAPYLTMAESLRIWPASSATGSPPPAVPAQS